MRISNKEIAHLLRSVAAVYTLKGENRFRIIAYENAAEALEQSTREIYDMWENGNLAGVAGIGPTLKTRLEEYFKKGNDSYLIKTINKLPLSVFVLMKVPGIGVKKAYKLVENLNIKNEKTAIPDLIKAAKENKISVLETFGEKSQSEILNALTVYEKSSSEKERMPLPQADHLAKEIIHYLFKNPAVIKAEALGSLRRNVSTIGDIDIAVVCKKQNCKEIIDHFIKYPGRIKTENKGDAKASIIAAGGRRVDVELTGEDSYGAMLQYFTGSKAHNIKLRTFALKKGYSLSEYGIKRLKVQKSNVKGQLSSVHKFKNEEEFYKFLGLSYIPPELREGTNEIDLALKKKLPNLIELADLKGEFHIHSNYNLEPSHDLGKNSIADLIKKARELKYEYIAISDHNPSIGNHTSEQIISIMKKRYEFIKKQAAGFNLIVSCEVDILPDGKIALPEAAIEFVDMIIISIHSSFRQSRQDMTKRILKALSYPKVKILGHPTARLIGKREEIEVDWKRIFEECRKRNIAVEINSWPERLDLPDTLASQAKKMGLKFTIDTDAHAGSQMDGIFYGVSVARRGWLEKGDVINTQSVDKVTSWIKN